MFNYYPQLAAKPSYHDSIKVFEIDIQYANMLPHPFKFRRPYPFECTIWLFPPQVKFPLCTLAETPRTAAHCIEYAHLIKWDEVHSGKTFDPDDPEHMKWIYNEVHSDGKLRMSSSRRRATIKEFYAIILPSLQHLSCNSSEFDISQEEGDGMEMIVRKKLDDKRKTAEGDLEREDECGICLEPCTKMVFPNCCHFMCINCYHDWSTRLESCPYFRGNFEEGEIRGLVGSDMQ
ncbi:hypothetical protein SO802_029669 [Lithocarpus litseifolius]|uniref:RING-type domain-containing protein n=1 Tax=Lithocarpus litseifolius TaxID=425828 RepID=A0AAW2BZE5_9ROSI